jgi:hypothetical protein
MKLHLSINWMKTTLNGEREKSRIALCLKLSDVLPSRLAPPQGLGELESEGHKYKGGTVLSGLWYHSRNHQPSLTNYKVWQSVQTQISVCADHCCCIFIDMILLLFHVPISGIPDLFLGISTLGASPTRACPIRSLSKKRTTCSLAPQKCGTQHGLSQEVSCSDKNWPFGHIKTTPGIPKQELVHKKNRFFHLSHGTCLKHPLTT